ncbi:MAG: ribosome maturation factor RimP [Bacteroidota bacterium]|nr:ribosome maturation factor RimP [Bacteroidota bacterium]
MDKYDGGDSKSPLFILVRNIDYQMDLKRKIEEMVLKNLESDKLFLVEVIIAGAATTQKVQILLDGDEGVDIDQCAKISRAIAAEIEELDLISDAYTLEVSSPGLDYPLQTTRQYQKNLGRMVKIALINDKVIKGKLLEIKEDKVKLSEEKKSNVKGKPPVYTEIELDIKDIKKTNVLASFT